MAGTGGRTPGGSMAYYPEGTPRHSAAHLHGSRHPYARRLRTPFSDIALA